MIKIIKLKAGPSGEKNGLEVELTPITVFVGPNNSGKSKVLIEIESQIKNGDVNPDNLVLDNIEPLPMTESEIIEDIERLKAPFISEARGGGHYSLGKLNPQSNSLGKIYVNTAVVIKEAISPALNWHSYAQYLSLYTLRLDGTNRLNLLQEQNAGDLQSVPKNHLAYLFSNNSVREEVRRIVFDAFGHYFVIDATNMGKLRARLSATRPKEERIERGWEQDAVDFHKSATLISEASDGIKAFIGIITTLLAGDPKITMIDEPEAFLHPALSSKLGKEIGISLRKTNKRLIISTHSASFLMGCIQSSAPLNIIRLTFNNGMATSRLLQQDKILRLMRNPLLRSTGVLNGLFYEAVIVTEADADRAFYQEINERLLSSNDPRGINNCLFINAQNKQTIWDIVAPLRDLGIPVVGIVDIDMLKEGGEVYTKFLKSCNIPPLSYGPLTIQRKAILDALNRVCDKDKWKREGGISLLDTATKESANDFFDQHKLYGAFVIRNGELESWLKDLGVTGHGPAWLLRMFDKMGENPDDPNYLKPSVGDVWGFIGEIKEWVTDNNRKGIPM